MLKTGFVGTGQFFPHSASKEALELKVRERTFGVPVNGRSGKRSGWVVLGVPGDPIVVMGAHTVPVDRDGKMCPVEVLRAPIVGALQLTTDGRVVLTLADAKKTRVVRCWATLEAAKKDSRYGEAASCLFVRE